MSVTGGAAAPASDQVANTTFSGPVSGADAPPSFRGQVFADMANLGGENDLYILKTLGSAIKGYCIGNAVMHNNASGSLGSGIVHWTCAILPIAATLTGVKFFALSPQAVYTSTGYNGVAIYTINPATGLLTQVAASTSSTTVWSVATAGMFSIPFSAPYAAAAGIYYVASLFQASAITTAPTVGSSSMIPSGVNYDLPFSMTLNGSSTNTILPATQASSGLGQTAFVVLSYLY